MSEGTLPDPGEQERILSDLDEQRRTLEALPPPSKLQTEAWGLCRRYSSQELRVLGAMLMNWDRVLTGSRGEE